MAQPLASLLQGHGMPSGTGDTPGSDHSLRRAGIRELPPLNLADGIAHGASLPHQVTYAVASEVAPASLDALSRTQNDSQSSVAVLSHATTTEARTSATMRAEQQTEIPDAPRLLSMELLALQQLCKLHEVETEESCSKSDLLVRLLDTKAKRLETVVQTQRSHLFESKKIVQDLQVESMPSMVKDAHYEYCGQTMRARVLYLSDAQAMGLRENMVPRLLSALEVKKPRMVINLLSSFLGKHYFDAESLFGKACYPDWSASEIEPCDSAVLEQQMMMFVRDCIIPAAMKTDALIIASASETCSLSAAFAKVALPIRQQLGEDCPFTVILTGTAFFFANRGMSATSHVSKLLSKVPEWNATHFEPALERVWGPKCDGNWNCADIVPGAAQYIIFEGLSDSKDRRVLGGARHFDRTLTQELQRSVPAIVIQCLGDLSVFTTGGSLPVSKYVSLGVPLLLLDARNRSLPKAQEELSMHKRSSLKPNESAFQIIEDALKELEQLMQRLWSAEKIDWQIYSNLAYLHEALDFNRSSDTVSQQGLPLYDAVEKAIKDKQVQKARYPEESEVVHESSSAAGNLHSEAVKEFAKDPFAYTASGILRLLAQQRRHMYNREIERCLAAYSCVLESEDTATFVARFQDEFFNMQCCMLPGSGLHAYVEKTPLKTIQRCNPDWFNFTGGQDIKGLAKSLRFGVDPNKVVEDQLRQELQKIKADLVMAKERQPREDEFYARDGGQLWYSIYDLLKCNHTESASLFDLKNAKLKLSRIARFDNLPEFHGPEALELIRTCWNTIDQFHHYAAWYRRVGCILYFFTLIAGVAIAIGTTIASNVGLATNLNKSTSESGSLLSFSMGIFSVTLFSTFIYGWIAFIDPSSKWMQLRGAALALESEVWMFRSRTGPYAMQVSGPHNTEAKMVAGERALHKAMSAIIQAAIETSGLKNTSFFADEESGHQSYFRHNQYCSTKRNAHAQVSSWVRDDHHSPLFADDYVCFRLRREMDYYKRRLPRHVRWRWGNQTVILVGNLAGVSLVGIGQPAWVILTTVVVAAFSSWQEFRGTNAKIQRISSTIRTLSMQDLWWKSLQHWEQASIHNVEELVMNTETALRGEWSAWLSTASAAKTQKKGDDAPQTPKSRGGSSFSQ